MAAGQDGTSKVNAGRMYWPFISKLEEEPVAACARECGVERDPRANAAHGVDMQVGEVTFAQYHQVPQSPNVRIQVADFLSLTGDADISSVSAPVATVPVSSTTS
jgi:hypothetical protein